MQGLNMKRMVATGLVFLAGLPLFGMAIFSLLSHLFRCPPEHPTCDLPDMAAFAMACIGSPLVSLLTAWYAWRRQRPGGRTAPL